MLKDFLHDKSGATAIEYGLIAALISVSLIAGYTALSESLTTQWTDTSSAIDNAGSSHLNE